MRYVSFYAPHEIFSWCSMLDPFGYPIKAPDRTKDYYLKYQQGLEKAGLGVRLKSTDSNQNGYGIEPTFINKNMELKITKEKVLEAASKCSTAKETLKTLFPEVFEPVEDVRLIRLRGKFALDHYEEFRNNLIKSIAYNIPTDLERKISGCTISERADAVIIALAKEFGW